MVKVKSRGRGRWRTRNGSINHFLLLPVPRSPRRVLELHISWAVGQLLVEPRTPAHPETTNPSGPCRDLLETPDGLELQNQLGLSQGCGAGVGEVGGENEALKNILEHSGIL